MYKKEPREASVSRACAAIYYARHCTNYILVEDTIRRNIVPVLAERLSASERHQILQEMAGILGDAGDHEQSAKLYELLHPGMKSIEKIDEATRAGFSRREATSIFATGKDIAKAHDLLEVAGQVNYRNPNTTVSIVNSRAWGNIAIGDYRAAYVLLEPLYRRYDARIFPGGKYIEKSTIEAAGMEDLPKANMTAWNAAELFQNVAVCTHHLNLECAEMVRLKSRRIFELSKSRPFMLRRNFWDTERNYERLVSPQFTIPSREDLPESLRIVVNEVIGLLKDPT
jgi:hypothetical protein